MVNKVGPYLCLTLTNSTCSEYNISTKFEGCMAQVDPPFVSSVVNDTCKNIADSGTDTFRKSIDNVVWPNA